MTSTKSQPRGRELLRGARENGALSLLVILFIFAAFAFANLARIAGGSDSSGYLNLSRRLAAGRTVENVEALDIFDLDEAYAGVFVPLGFTVGPDGTSLPYYPPGMPLQMAVLEALAGPDVGPFLVPPLAGLLGLAAFFVLVRQLGLSARFALAGTAMMAVCPTYLSYSLQPMSDAVATAFVTMALAAALVARQQVWWMLVAAAAFGMGVLVRPTVVLLLPALLIAMPFTVRGYLLLVIGGAPFALFNVTYNYFTYGGMFVTGYGGIGNIETSWEWFSPRFTHYTQWLTTLLSPLVALASLIFPFDSNVPRRTRALLVVWFVPTFTFYCTYQHYDAWGYTRFLLPAMGALVVAALFVARDVLSSLNRAQWLWAPTLASEERQRVVKGIGIALLTMVIVASVYHNSWLHVLFVDEGEASYRAACLGVNEQAPARTVVLAMQASGALEYYTHAVVARWDQLEPESFNLLRDRFEARGYAVYALLFPFESERFQ